MHVYEERMSTMKKNNNICDADHHFIVSCRLLVYTQYFWHLHKFLEYRSRLCPLDQQQMQGRPPSIIRLKSECRIS